MDWKQAFQRWINAPYLDKDTRAELEAIQDAEDVIEDSFYKNLTFGTGGMRGVMGPGPNRMNRYTVRKASEGLARYIETYGQEAQRQGVVIAYDSRYRSAEFAKEAALTLGHHGIKAYLFDDMRPTPELSFAVRHLKAFAGIVITASHNPPQYNGYKVYGDDGGQLPPKTADEVIAQVNEVADELAVAIGHDQELRNAGLLTMIGKKIDWAYVEKLQSISVNPDMIQERASSLKIVYTPLHGTGHHLVRQGLTALGFPHVTTVAEQAEADPEFSTVDSPNPEESAAFERAISYGKRVDADLLLATDPDADRVGVAVKNNAGEYVVLTGNQTGALLLHYLLSQKHQNGVLPKDGAVLKTIVTSELGRAIAANYGVKTIDTLTGFKFIGEKIKEYQQSNDFTFLFGYEESYGYLIGDFVRDKDAVQACLFAAEVAAYYKSQGQSLYDALLALFDQYGWYQEALASITLKGKDGQAEIANIMENFRQHPLHELAGRAVVTVEDYERRQRIDADGNVAALTLPAANVIKYTFEDGSWFCLRPSGTEPKMKIYVAVCAKTAEESQQALEQLKAAVMEKVNNLLEQHGSKPQ